MRKIYTEDLPQSIRQVVFVDTVYENTKPHPKDADIKRSEHKKDRAM